ncbi:hypothetical protein MKW35_17355, partial [Aestuariibaculum sp. L182]|nr:hypothetical protein [Aestuariibaculum lutulentum]
MKALTLASRDQSRPRPFSAAPVRCGTIGHDRNPDPSSMAAKPRNEACRADDLVIRVRGDHQRDTHVSQRDLHRMGSRMCSATA